MTFTEKLERLGLLQEFKKELKLQNRTDQYMAILATIKEPSKMLMASLVLSDTKNKDTWIKLFNLLRTLEVMGIPLKNDIDKLFKNKNKNSDRGKGKTMKNKKFKAFSKNKLNVKGLFYQAKKAGTFLDRRPFVLKAMKDECIRVSEEIQKREFTSKNFNIKLAAYAEEINKAKETGKVGPYLPTTTVVAYYEFLNEEKNEENYNWIKKHLTPRNVENPERVYLFKSKNREIYIEDGLLVLVENNIMYYVEIKYSNKTNELYI